MKSILRLNLSLESLRITTSMYLLPTTWETNKITRQTIDIRTPKITFSSNKITPRIWHSAMSAIMASRLRKEATLRTTSSISAKPKNHYNRLKMPTSWTKKRHPTLQREQRNHWFRRLQRKNKKQNSLTWIKLYQITLSLMTLLAQKSLTLNPLKRRQ